MNRTLQILLTFVCSTFVLANSAFAQQVELTAKDGSRTVTGEIISFDGTRYMMRTAIGVLPFDAQEFTCAGLSCPSMFTEDANLFVAGPAELADVVLPLLAEGYAEEQELYAKILDKNGLPIDDQRAFSGSDAAKEEYGLFDIQLSEEESDQVQNILVQEATGDRLFDLLTSQDVGIIISEDTVSEANLQLARQKGIGDLSSFEQERIIAVDGFTAVVNPRNQVGQLTIAQVSQIMAGEISNWRELGGSDRKINVYTFAEDTEAFHNIRDLVLTPFNRSLTINAKEMDSNRALSRALEEDRFGFGVVNYSSIRGAKAVPIENECGMVIQPDPFSMKTEEYPLQKRVSVYSNRELTDLGKSFLTFMDNPITDDIVAKSGLISLAIIPEDEGQKLERLDRAVKFVDKATSRDTLQSLVLDMLETERLSTVFRFSPNSVQLDNKARRDVRRALDYIREQKPKRVVIAGFTDSVGNFDLNRKLAADRAASVWKTMNALAEPGDLSQTEVLVRGYGELVPIACNETLKGRSMNRRVEIWSEN